MYVSAVYILTSIVNLQLTLDLSLTPFDIIQPPETVTLKPLPLNFLCTWKLFPQYLPTLWLPYVPLEAYYTCIHSKYLDCDRRPAQHTSWSPHPEPPRIWKPWDPVYMLGSLGLTCNNTCMFHPFCYGLLQCYPARYFGNLEGSEGLEMKGFWTAASAHALCLPSIIVQVFKVLTSSEKYVKIPENYFQKVRCFPKDSGCFQAVSGGRKLRRRFPERSKSFPVSRVRRKLGKYLQAAERCGWVSEGWYQVMLWKQKSAKKL